MKKFDIFSFALSNFLRRKARSALTVLGVVIGTAAVVIMLSIGIGMNKGFEDQISSWGDLREITVYELWGSYNEETGQWEQNEAREPLDDISLEAIRNIDHVKVATPRDSYWGAYLVMNNEKIETGASVYGIDASAMKELGYEVLYGRLLDESDIGTTNFVMCYNIPFYFYDCKYKDWSEQVWWYESTEGEELPFNPVDDKIKYQFTWQYSYGNEAVDTTKPRIINQDAKCVGILVQSINTWGTDYSSEIYMDITGLRDLRTKLQENQNKYNQSGSDYGYGYADMVIVGGGYSYEDESSAYSDGRKSIYNYFTVMVDDTDHVGDVLKEIRDMGFDPSSSMDYLEQMQEQTKFLRSILGAIGAVAFFVAAISIANTMVMSIYERTREIGIMKVIGCKLKDIRGMFLVEAAIIGIVGGALGVGLSYGLSALVKNLAADGGMESFGIYGSESALSIIPLWLDGAALILATAVGVVSGLYPAIRATRLSALEAIKNE